MQRTWLDLCQVEFVILLPLTFLLQTAYQRLNVPVVQHVTSFVVVVVHSRAMWGSAGAIK